jgi:spermidine synthase
MTRTNRRWLGLLFFVSGFCGLLYQMVWTRLAFAAFGIIAPVLSVVISVFMLGLFAGSWAGGKSISWLKAKTGLSAVFFYGGAELVIGLGAFAVPGLFALGKRCLFSAGQADSFTYLLLSAMVLAASILPWCVFMGATFPWMMAYIRERDSQNADSFSFLYVANVLGAMAGTIVTAYVLIELLGFHRTLTAAALGNFAIAAVSFCLGAMNRGQTQMAPAATEAVRPAAVFPEAGAPLIRWILFTTGFCAMAMEVAWTRAFIPVLKTEVYSFALIVFAYLAATFLGSVIYRIRLRAGTQAPLGTLMVLLGLAGILPILMLDPRILPVKLVTVGMYNDVSSAVACVLSSICPICAVLGYITPGLIDQYAAGQPAAAGKAYAINVLGCILGPLVASYLLLPHFGERYVLVILSAPLLLLGFTCRQPKGFAVRVAGGLAAAAVVWSLFFATDYEKLLKKMDPNTQVRRDYAASVYSAGKGFGRTLLVNGVGMTILASETKYMVHLPATLHNGPSKSALIICFGMGTSFRAALSWGLNTTAVELVPNVVNAFGFYHEDAGRVLQDPNAHIVIDDGRRFLERTREKYDIIVVDPPPPVEAAGSSLLYTPEFYKLVKEHLDTNGILQIWFPGSSMSTAQAMARSVASSFPFVRSIPGLHGWGTHFLASMQPVHLLSSAKMAARMPPRAQRDLMEWLDPRSFPTPADALEFVMYREFPLAAALNPDPAFEITDDRPFSEYYLLRLKGFYHP